LEKHLTTEGTEIHWK